MHKLNQNSKDESTIQYELNLVVIQLTSSAHHFDLTLVLRANKFKTIYHLKLTRFMLKYF